MMYDPKTGKGYKADTYEDHVRMDKMGYVHEKPKGPFKQTTGHNHSGQEEVYFFVSGSGRMLLDDEEFDVKAGDVVLIPDGAFHRVINNTGEPFYFVCVFDGKRSH